MHQAERSQFEKFDASNYKVGIVVALFNSDITMALLNQALEMLKNYKVKADNIYFCKVAGSIEIPLILKTLAETKKYDCLIALGAVIRGETAHFDYVCKIVSEGVLKVMLDYGIPIGFGILTTNTLQQAQARIDAGAAAVEAALQSANIIKEIKEKI